MTSAFRVIAAVQTSAEVVEGWFVLAESSDSPVILVVYGPVIGGTILNRR
jgi:hypothetical protein